MSCWRGFDLRRFRLSTGKVPFSRSLGLQRLLCHEQSSQGPLLYQQERPTVLLFSKLFNGCFQVVFRVSIRFSRHTWVSTESSLASECETRHWSRVWKNHILSLSIFNSWFRFNYQLCERNTTKVCRMMLLYRTKIRIEYTNPSANCATGVCDHDLASRGSDRHRRWGGRSQRGPIRICTRLLNGRAHATQFLRAGDLPPTSTVLSTCLALPRWSSRGKRKRGKVV